MDISEAVALALMENRLVPKPHGSGKTTRVIEMVKKELSAGRDACIIYGVPGSKYPYGIRTAYINSQRIWSVIRGYRGKFFTDEVRPADVDQLKIVLGRDNYGGGFYTPRDLDV